MIPVTIAGQVERSYLPWYYLRITLVLPTYYLCIGIFVRQTKVELIVFTIIKICKPGFNGL